MSPTARGSARAVAAVTACLGILSAWPAQAQDDAQSDAQGEAPEEESAFSLDGEVSAHWRGTVNHRVGRDGNDQEALTFGDVALTYTLSPARRVVLHVAGDWRKDLDGVGRREGSTDLYDGYGHRSFGRVREANLEVGSLIAKDLKLYLGRVGVWRSYPVTVDGFSARYRQGNLSGTGYFGASVSWYESSSRRTARPMAGGAELTYAFGPGRSVRLRSDYYIDSLSECMVRFALDEQWRVSASYSMVDLTPHYARGALVYSDCDWPLELSLRGCVYLTDGDPNDDEHDQRREAWMYDYLGGDNDWGTPYERFRLGYLHESALGEFDATVVLSDEVSVSLTAGWQALLDQPWDSYRTSAFTGSCGFSYRPSFLPGVRLYGSGSTWIDEREVSELTQHLVDAGVELHPFSEFLLDVGGFHCWSRLDSKPWKSVGARARAWWLIAGSYRLSVRYEVAWDEITRRYEGTHDIQRGEVSFAVLF